MSQSVEIKVPDFVN